jgi:Carboxypeptidase regulatory-like domain
MSQRRSQDGTRLRSAGVAAILALVCVFAVEATAAPAKELKKPTRTVTGMVLDKDDNPIEGAVVTMTDVSNGKKNATYTQKDGRYLFSGLEPTRNYDVQATFHGEPSQVRHVTAIDPRDRIVLHLKIPPLPEEAGEN